MAASPPKPPSTVQGEALLQSLGYRQELKRKINILGSLALVLSDITPTASLLIVGTVVILGAGTGSIAAYLIGCFLAINVALCMGELGSTFPVAGGLFSIVTRVPGKPTGFLAMLDYMGQAARSEEHTSELQSPYDLACRLLLAKKTNVCLRS